MKDTKVVADAELLSLIKQFGNEVLIQCSAQWQPPAYKSAITGGRGMLKWNNPENIETGASGTIIFLLELYTLLKDPAYLGAADKLIAELLDHCSNTSTSNYSLYTGRAGLVYAIMQRHAIDRKGRLLKECIELMRPATNEYLESAYTTDYLYDGRAGTLLVLMHLYAITKEDSLLESICRFAAKIISNVVPGAQHLVWQNAEDFDIQPSGGFALGTAGIAYVLAQFNQLSPSPAINFLLTELERYSRAIQTRADYKTNILSQEELNQYRQARKERAANLHAVKDQMGWANGAAGIMMAYPVPSGDIKESIIKNLHSTGSDATLYDGIAGLGACCWFMNKATNDYAWKELAYAAADELRLYLAKVNPSGGLMHGTMGAIYFLAKITGDLERSENILAPLSTKLPAASLPQPLITSPQLSKLLLSKYYPRTLYVMQANAAGILEAHIEAAQSLNWEKQLIAFNRFMTEQAGHLLPASLNERIRDLFRLEKMKAAFLAAEKRNALEVYIDGLLHQDAVMEQLNQPDEWLLQQRLRVSPSVIIAASKWDWSFQQDLKKMPPEKMYEKQLQNCTLPAGEFYYLFQVFARLEVTEFPLSTSLSQILHVLHEPRNAGEVFGDIQRLFTSMPITMVKRIFPELNNIPPAATEECFSELHRIILSQVRILIYRRILVLVD